MNSFWSFEREHPHIAFGIFALVFAAIMGAIGGLTVYFESPWIILCPLALVIGIYWGVNRD